MEDYRAVNRAWWDERAAAHAAALDGQRYAADPGFLSPVVRFDLPRLGAVSGLRGVHLQCHIGTDTVSLARLGASMTGLDFSAAAVRQARRLAGRIGADARFVQAEVYAAVEVLGRGAFDLVYTGIGALCWLPGIGRWAQVAADLLRPGGRLFLREGHPMLWALDKAGPEDLLVVRYPYFEQEEPLILEDTGSYLPTGAVFQHASTRVWNHGLGEILTAVLDAGLQITALTEHDSVPWQALPGKMERIGGGEWRLADQPWRLPHSYTLQAAKPGR
jgi:SAM-dependent methyltransferase